MMEGVRGTTSHKAQSVIDLTLTSNTIADVSTWEVLNRSTVGSDHCPIIVKIGTEIYQNGGVRPSRWKLDKADWDTFQVLSEASCVKPVFFNLF